jgi:hypothetical protein
MIPAFQRSLVEEILSAKLLEDHKVGWIVVCAPSNMVVNSSIQNSHSICGIGFSSIDE